MNSLLDFVKKNKKAIVAAVAAILLMVGVISQTDFDTYVEVNEPTIDDIVNYDPANGVIE